MSYTLDRRFEASRRGLVALAFALAACGSDATGPEIVDLTGSWDYVIADATGPFLDFTTSISNITLTFAGAGDTLEGAVTAGGGDNLTATLSDGTQAFRTVSGTSSIQNLSINGTGIEFEFWDLSSPSLSDAHPIISTGTIAQNANSMSGTVTMTLLAETGIGVIVTRQATGNWTATRK